MCEHCRSAELENKCPSCHVEGKSVDEKIVDKSLIYKRFYKGEYRECTNKSCAVKFYSEHRAYFNDDIK